LELQLVRWRIGAEQPHVCARLTFRSGSSIRRNCDARPQSGKRVRRWGTKLVESRNAFPRSKRSDASNLRSKRERRAIVLAGSVRIHGTLRRQGVDARECVEHRCPRALHLRSHGHWSGGRRSGRCCRRQLA
jgi:hypothetical protein